MLRAVLRNLSKETLTNLADCMYIKMGMNILISGGTRCKSYLACALAYEACAKGIKAMYFNMNKLTEQILLSKGRWHIFKTASKIRKIPITCIGRLWLTDYKQRAGTGHTQIPEDRYNKNQPSL